MDISQIEFHLLQKLIYEKTGINIDEQKKDLIISRLAQRSTPEPRASGAEYV